MNPSDLMMEDGSEMNALLQHLDRIDSAFARLSRVAFCGHGVVRFRFGDAPMVLRFIDGEASFIPALSLQLRIGHTQGWLLLSSYDVVGWEWADIFERLDSMLVRALLIEEVSNQFDNLAQATGETIQILDLQVGLGGAEKGMTQALRIENESTAVGILAALHSNNPDFFAILARMLARNASCAPQFPRSARLPIRFSLGVAWLRHDEVEQSRIGDVFVFPMSGTINSVNALCIDRYRRRLPLRARLEGCNGHLSFYEGEIMINEPNEMQMEGSVALEQCSVPITAVIGELELPLQKIGALQAGYVFELQTSVEQAIVQLYTGSRCVGRGRLVVIGDRLGVRLLQWGGGAHDEST